MKASYEVHSLWEDDSGNTVSQLDISIRLDGDGKAIGQIKNVIDTISLTVIDLVDEIDTGESKPKQA